MSLPSISCENGLRNLRSPPSITNSAQTFTWKPSQALVMLGLGYIGLWDELAIFNRALSAQEIKSLYELDGGCGLCSK